MGKKVVEVTRKSRWIVSAVSLALLGLIGLIRSEGEPSETTEAQAQPDEEAALFIG